MLTKLFNQKTISPSSSIRSTTRSQETIDILRLIRSENVGVKTFYSLINLYGNAKTALENIAELSLKGGKNKPIKIYSISEAEKELKKLSDIGAVAITYKDKEYPHLLKQIADPPPILSMHGKLEILQNKIIAVVGARNSSGNGIAFTNQIVKSLGKEGYIIVSGLARGIDTSAHKAAIETGTIAVIAGGLEHIYPPENEELYNHITKKGLVISELPIGSIPRAQNFPQRNRIISGLSIATIVVEASLKSGSLITAKFAAEQGREVLAVPGFPLDPRAQGTNRLIKQGAMLIESIEDLIENLPEENLHLKFQENNITDFNNFKPIVIDEKHLNDARRKILQLLSSCPIEIDMLFIQSKIELPMLHTILLELELAGKLERHVGNKVSLNYDLK